MEENRIYKLRCSGTIESEQYEKPEKYYKNLKKAVEQKNKEMKEFKNTHKNWYVKNYYDTIGYIYKEQDIQRWEIEKITLND